MSASGAETLYVTDRLLLGLHQAADTSDAPFTTMESGTELEVLERTRQFARVRTPDGREGWAKLGFLVADKPARTVLAELRAENAALSEDRSALEARLERTAAELARIRSQLETADDERQQLAEVRAENNRYREVLARAASRVPLNLVLAGIAITLVLGFAGGYGWLDLRLRRRFGVRIH